MILILGTPEDGCVGDALAHLRQRGHEVLVVPEAQLPDALQYKWELPSPIEAGYLQVPIQDLTGVLVRLRQTFQASLMEMDDRAYIRAEWSALLYGFLKSLPCPVVNRPRPGAGQRFPETQAVAGALRRAGFLPPPTLVTASVEAARGFFERHARRVLCAAPGYAGHYLLDGRARGSLVERGRAFRLQAVPTGRCLRVVVVGRAAFGAEAAGSELLNFSREPWHRAALPTAFANRCVRLASLLELEFVELLAMRGESHDFVLAVNDLPDPARYDAALRDAIAAALCDALTPQTPPSRRASAQAQRPGLWTLNIGLQTSP